MKAGSSRMMNQRKEEGTFLFYRLKTQVCEPFVYLQITNYKGLL